MDYRRVSSLFWLFGLQVILGGCAAAVIAPIAMQGAQIIGGNMESGAKATIDEATVTPEIRDAFATAKTLAFVAGDRASVKAADIFETQGGYLVSLDRSTAANGELTTSERREALRKLCAGARPDIALLGRVTKTDNTGVAYYMVTGRAKQTQNWVMELLVCRTNTPHSFSGAIEFDEGVWNTTASGKIEEMMGQAMGNKLLLTLGKAKTEGSEATGGTPASSAAATAAAAKPISMTPTEIQQKLIDLGYLKGKADGIFGRMSVSALKKFQHDAKLPETGKVDDETLSKLSAAGKS